MKVIIHSSVSLDGSLLGVEVDMAAHYKIAGSYKADIHLIGSNTAAAGLKMSNPQIPKELDKDGLWLVYQMLKYGKAKA